VPGFEGDEQRWPRVAANVLSATLAVATATAIIGYSTLGPAARFCAVFVAFGSFGALFLRPLRGCALTTRRVVVLGSLLVVVALLTPPRGSHDIWSYAAYGRMVSVHHVSPFTRVPAAFPHDPLFHHVSRDWRHTGSVYGPVFVAVSAIGTAMTGASAPATRLFFQLIEALALGGALLIIWRRTRDPVALAFVALNPALILVVNGGHNDILVGLALLGGALLLADGHPRRAGIVLALGALVKLIVLLPLGVLVLWTWRRWGARVAVELGATAAVVLAAAYVVCGGTRALGPLLHASEQHNRWSVWEQVRRCVAVPLELHRASLFEIESKVALLLVVAVAVVIVVRARTRTSDATGADQSAIATVAGAAALAFLLTGPYVLPWYSAWALPLLALVWSSRVAVLAAGQAVLIAVAAAAPALSVAGFATPGEVVPVVLAGALAYLVWSAWRGRLELPVGGDPPTAGSVVPVSDERSASGSGPTGSPLRRGGAPRV
jgi:hypothetical protein